eukprot:m.28329 g.28329  ORF g.28329 m.28329 type:complete len:616 (+) comp11827_c0_seq1:59-1906(+)
MAQPTDLNHRLGIRRLSSSDRLELMNNVLPENNTRESMVSQFAVELNPSPNEETVPVKQSRRNFMSRLFRGRRSSSASPKQSPKLSRRQAGGQSQQVLGGQQVETQRRSEQLGDWAMDAFEWDDTDVTLSTTRGFAWLQSIGIVPHSYKVDDLNHEQKHAVDQILTKLQQHKIDETSLESNSHEVEAFLQEDIQKLMLLMPSYSRRNTLAPEPVAPSVGRAWKSPRPSGAASRSKGKVVGFNAKNLQRTETDETDQSKRVSPKEVTAITQRLAFAWVHGKRNLQFNQMLEQEMQQLLIMSRARLQAEIISLRRENHTLRQQQPVSDQQWQKSLTAEKAFTVKLQDICDERDRQVSALSTELRVANDELAVLRARRDVTPSVSSQSQHDYPMYEASTFESTASSEPPTLYNTTGFNAKPAPPADDGNNHTPSHPTKPPMRLGISQTLLSMDSQDEEPYVGYTPSGSLSELSGMAASASPTSTSPHQRRESLAQRTAVRNSQPQFQPSLPSDCHDSDVDRVRRSSVRSHVSALADPQPVDSPYRFLSTPNRDRSMTDLLSRQQRLNSLLDMYSVPSAGRDDLWKAASQGSRREQQLNFLDPTQQSHLTRQLSGEYVV